MLTLIHSDLKRLFADWKRWTLVAAAAVLLIFLTALGMILSGDSTSSRFLSNFSVNMTAAGCIVGAIELSWVYAADLKANIYPALIGAGLERWKIVLAKFAVFAMLVLADIVILGAVGFAAGQVCGISLDGIYAARFAKYLFCVYLYMMAAALPSVLVLYLTDKVIFMTAVFLLLMADLLPSVINSAAEQAGLDLSFLDVNQQIRLLGSCIAGGAFNIFAALTIVVYASVLVSACLAVFKKKELNF